MKHERVSEIPKYIELFQYAVNSNREVVDMYPTVSQEILLYVAYFNLVSTKIHHS
jgi:hypothetical protein